MSVNVISSEDIENYKQMLEKHMADEAADAKHDDYYAGYFDGLKKAIDLVEKLDESQKIVVPQFVDDWIENARIYYGDEVEPLRILYWIGDYVDDTSSHYEWLKNEKNQKLLLNALANGYEVEKEPKYYVQIKGFYHFIDSKYVNYRTSDGTFGLDCKLQTENIKTAFTKSWLKDNWSEYEAYNDAGLLEFEEVEK